MSSKSNYVCMSEEEARFCLESIWGVVTGEQMYSQASLYLLRFFLKDATGQERINLRKELKKREECF